MAYVAITDRLVNDVSNKIGVMRTAEINAMPDPQPTITEIIRDPAVTAMVVEKMWEPVADIRGRLEAYDREVTVRIKVKHRSTNDDGAVVNHLMTEFDVKAKVPCIVAVEDGYYPRAKYLMFSDCDERFASVWEMQSNRREASDRWEAVSKQVTEFLKSCKSLNEAVKLWPDVTRYISKDDMDRLEKNAPKAQKEVSKAMEALKAMDLDAINASTELARMAGAKV